MASQISSNNTEKNTDFFSWAYNDIVNNPKGIVVPDIVINRALAYLHNTGAYDLPYITEHCYSTGGELLREFREVDFHSQMLSDDGTIFVNDNWFAYHIDRFGNTTIRYRLNGKVLVAAGHQEPIDPAKIINLRDILLHGRCPL